MAAPQAASAMAAAIRHVAPSATVMELPIADGGEGFMDTVAAMIGARIVEVEVHDQRGLPHMAGFALADSGPMPTAVLEGAATSGLDLVPAAERDIMSFDTRGLGELMTAAIDAGAKRLVIGIGGSSTNDAGAGMLSALGVRFQDQNEVELPPNPTGLARLAAVDLTGLDPRLQTIRIEVACDVTNPLLGQTGAAAIYGPQKGASPEQITILDGILAHLLEVCGPQARAAADIPGAGAAGGLGWALNHMLGAELRPGFELVADLVDLDRYLAKADLVLGAEGSVDFQTPHGKAIARLCSHAEQAGVPVMIFGGRVDLDPAELPGRVEIFCITPDGQPLDEALRQGPQNLTEAVRQAIAPRACAHRGS